MGCRASLSQSPPEAVSSRPQASRPYPRPSLTLRTSSGATNTEFRRAIPVRNPKFRTIVGMSEGGPPRWFDDTRQVAGQLSGDFKCYAAAHFSAC
jgi:hypothetical protein